jgi:hypothetical protein
MMEHKFGVVIFIPIGVTKIDPFRWEADDPFCYNCGQKLMNVPLKDIVGKTCEGPQKGSINKTKVYSE